jgi:hypothetical protein
LLLHHDNGNTHASLKTTEFMTNTMVIVLHPTNLLDLAPCDFVVSQIKNETEEMMF